MEQGYALGSEKKIEETVITQTISAFFESQYSVLDGFQYLVSQRLDVNSSAYADSKKMGWMPPNVNKQLKGNFPEDMEPFEIFPLLDIATAFESKPKKLECWKMVSFV